MKITKILFLGIVCVMLQVMYLQAQATDADTLFVRTTIAEPGEQVQITFELRIHSSAVNATVNVIEGVPAFLTMPETEGFAWGANFGQILVDNIGFLPEIASLEDGILSASVMLVDIDELVADGDLASAGGDLVTYTLDVPADAPLGEYPLSVSLDGSGDRAVTLLNAALTGTISYPVVIADPIIVAEIPDNNYLEMVAAQGVTSGGTAEIGVMLANKDIVGSGSFKIAYDDAVMTLDSVVAGSRATGVSFGFTNPQAESGTALAADVGTTVSFSGATLAMGALGDLCKLYFDIAEVGAGAMASVTLSEVVLKDPSNAALPDQIDPIVPATALTFSYGDTLSLADMMGEGTATIIDGQLYVPVMLKNASAVSAVEFVIMEPVGNDSILSLSAEKIANIDRVDGWMISAMDSIRGVRVIAFPAVEGTSIPADNGKLFDVVFDINTNAFTVPAAGENPVDLILGLSGVSITSSSGSLLGVEAMGATASLDYRVPNDGEGTGPGVTLPRAFSLQQNHPNPFNPSTTINYQIPDDVGSVRFSMNVYDLRGRMVRVLDQGMKAAGTYSVFWDGTDSNGRQVSSGVYFYRFVSSEYNATRKMIMLK